MNTRTARVALVSVLGMTMTMSTLAEESTYRFTRGFPAGETTIKQAQDATALRRAIEAYKYASGPENEPTVICGESSNGKS